MIFLLKKIEIAGGSRTLKALKRVLIAYVCFSVLFGTIYYHTPMLDAFFKAVVPQEMSVQLGNGFYYRNGYIHSQGAAVEIAANVIALKTYGKTVYGYHDTGYNKAKHTYFICNNDEHCMICARGENSYRECAKNQDYTKAEFEKLLEVRNLPRFIGVQTPKSLLTTEWIKRDLDFRESYNPLMVRGSILEETKKFFSLIGALFLVPSLVYGAHIMLLVAGLCLLLVWSVRVRAHKKMIIFSHVVIGRLVGRIRKLKSLQRLSLLVVLLLLVFCVIFEFLPAIKEAQRYVSEENFENFKLSCEFLLSDRPWYGRVNHWFFVWLILVPTLVFSISPNSAAWKRGLTIIVVTFVCYVLMNLAVYQGWNIRNAPFGWHGYRVGTESGYRMDCANMADGFSLVFAAFFGWIPACVYTGLCLSFWRFYHRRFSQKIVLSYEGDIITRILNAGLRIHILLMAVCLIALAMYMAGLLYTRPLIQALYYLTLRPLMIPFEIFWY